MVRKFFGTDGVRGRANQYPINAEMTLKLGAAVGRYFRRDGNEHRVVIGKDTRRSGYMLENALTAGLTSTGMNVFLLGPIPTPGVGLLTRSMRADLGVMISASHNPHYDNGIKLFGPDGYKLNDQSEAEIEELLEHDIDRASAENIGKAKRIDDGLGRYVERVKSTFPSGVRLDGIKIVVDCANGAAYRSAPEVLWELGADVIPIGINPDGFNINKDCGSTNTQAIKEAVLSNKADLGICLDGDADRVILIDEFGVEGDGDQILAVLAGRWARQGILTGGTLVSTVMSNLGLERYLKSKSVALLRTSVGDRYVVEAMRKGGYNLGGEQSGHIVMTDHSTTGDGIVAALQFLSIMKKENTPASLLLHQFEAYPQKLLNIAYSPNKDPLKIDSVQETINRLEKKLFGIGRVLIRKSGTEPLIRIMAECEDEALLSNVVDEIAEKIKLECGND
jgi:phosphoglucosamine mutase